MLAQSLIDRARSVDVRGAVARHVPIVTWLPAYPRSDLRPELIAALVSWAVGVPVALAYAGLAGMPAEVGLVTAFAALAAYAIFGTSRHLRVTASSTMAIMSTRSQLSSLVVSALMLITAIALAPLFRDLAQATLAAIVIVSVLGLIDLGEMRRFYDWRRLDLAIALVALVGVVTTDALTGLVIAAILSLTALLYRASRPDLVVLGRLSNENAFGDVERHADAHQIQGVLIVRIDTPLYFFNAQEATTQTLKRVTEDPSVRVVVADLGATGDLDVTATDMLAELHSELERRDVTLLLAHVKGTVRDRLRRTGFMSVLGEDHAYQTLTGAVNDAESRVTDSSVGTMKS